MEINRNTIATTMAIIWMPLSLIAFFLPVVKWSFLISLKLENLLTTYLFIPIETINEGVSMEARGLITAALIMAILCFIALTPIAVVTEYKAIKKHRNSLMKIPILLLASYVILFILNTIFPLYTFLANVLGENLNFTYFFILIGILYSIYRILNITMNKLVTVLILKDGGDAYEIK